MAAEELLKEIKRAVKEEALFADAVSDIDFEGPKVVLYCQNLDLLLENGEVIKDLAKKIRKRIILRPDPSILTDKEEAEAQIKKLVPEDAGITDIIFSEDVGEVTIEAEKPGIVIGKGGALLRELMHKIKWTPRVVRAPPIKSDLVRNIRLSMIQAGSERRDILRKIGRRIHREKKAKGDWVRFTVLGGGREVGRSCFLLQTPESRVMVDCGVNVASEDRAFPHLEVPEVRLPELDAVVLTHAHLDHCGFIPYLFKYGFEGPVYCTPATRDLAVLLQLDYVDIAEREDKLLPYNKRDISRFLAHCIQLDYGDVTDIAPDIRVTLHNAGHILGCVAPDTLVVLADGLICRIEEIAGNPTPKNIEALAADFDSFSFRPALAQVWSKAWNGPLYRVRTASGCEIRVTPEHPFFILRNGSVAWVRTDQLRFGDFVATVSRLHVRGTPQRLKCDFQRGRARNALRIKAPRITSPELCQLLGYVLGDGSVAWSCHDKVAFLQITDQNETNLRSYADLVTAIFGLPPGHIHPTSKANNFSKTLTIHSTELVRFLTLNFPGLLARSPKRVIPPMLTKISDVELAAFLRGLFDAEGYVGKNQLQLAMTSADVIQKAYLLLLRFGIHSRYRSKEQSQHAKGKARVHILTITDRDSLDKFAASIGFGDGVKALKLSRLTTQPRHPRRLGSRYAPVPEIGPLLKTIRKGLFLRRACLPITVKHYETGGHATNRRALLELIDIFDKRLAELRCIRNHVQSDPESVRVALGLSFGTVGRACGLRAESVYFALKRAKRGGPRTAMYRKQVKDHLADLLREECLAQVASVVRLLDQIATSDIRWDRVEQIESTPSSGRVFDLTVPGYQSFITNGIVSHNSSIAHFHVGEGVHNIVYSGDLKFDRTRLFSPAVYTFPRVETLIIDSTYGGSGDVQPYRADAEKEFIRVVTETIKRGGKVVVPAFAVGRAQEIMVLLEDCKRKGILNGAPVYLDGMIWEATAIHTAYPEYLSQDLRELIFRADENPFLSDMFIKVSGPDQRAQVIDGEPAIVISTAGMMAGGPVIEYFKHLAPDPRNTLVFVGYQCEGSLGRRIQKGWREVPLQGEKGRVEEVKVNMEIKTIEGFSGHSDRAQLLNYVRRISPKPDRIVSIHGDENKCADLASTLHRLFRVESRAPMNLETIRLH